MSSSPHHDSDKEKRSKNISSFIRILRYARSEWKALAISVSILAAASFTGVLSAMFLGDLVQDGLVAHNVAASWKFGAWVIGAEAFSVAASYYGRLLMAESSNAALFHIRERLFNHLNLLPMTYFDREPLGRTVTRVTYDVEGLEDFFGSTLARLLNALLTVVIVVIGMMATDLRLGLIVTGSMIPAAIITWATRKSVRHWNREFSRRNSAINAKLSEFLNGLPVIRYFGAEKWSAESFDGTVDSHLEAALKINVLNSYIRPIVLILCAMPLVFLLYFGGQQVLAGVLSTGVFVAFIRYTERFSRPITAIAQEIQTIQQAFTSAERVNRFLDHSTEISTLGADGSFAPKSLRGDIEFRNVTMGYSTQRTALNGVSFQITAGEKIGLAGRTGSGKSTTASLLSRLYEFQSGEIVIDGISIRDFSRNVLRSHIGFVSQDVTIFRGQLRENLAFGAAVSDSDILRAAQRTGLDLILDRRGLQLDSLILDQGMNLSSGERQLVALTRVLLKDPSLLILDEATSNVDETCEDLLQGAVLSVMKGRTCLMIAHRLSTLEACDRILVFRDGLIVEEGRHVDLLAQGGYYTQLLHEGKGLSPEIVL